MSAPALPVIDGPRDGGPDRRMVSLRLTGEARDILCRLSERRGISQAAILEVLLREAGEPRLSSV